MTSNPSATHAPCLRCGECCRAPGYVHLKPDEVEVLAAHLGMAVYEFTARHTRLTRERAGLSLTEAEDGACVFLHPDGSCSVHEVKPRQCRTFPKEWRFPGFEVICLAARVNRERAGAPDTANERASEYERR